MAVLREFRRTGRDFMQGAASSYNRAFQPLHTPPLSMSPHALAILLLPCLVGEFFCDDGIPSSDNLMHESTMQALAIGGQLALVSRQTATGHFVALALFPSLLAFFDTSFVVIVLWVIGPALSIQFPLEAALLALISLEFLAEGEQACFTRFMHHGKGGRTKIKTNGCRPYLMLRFLVGNTREAQLPIVAIALTVGSLRLWTRGTT